MNEAEILDYLTTQGIDYECQRHPAVLTMDEAERLALPHPECEARNLFGAREPDAPDISC